MKKFAFLLLFFLNFISYNFGESELITKQEFHGIPTGLLTFSERIPAELTKENEEILAKERLIQQGRNESIQRSKTLPWKQIVLSLIALIFFLFLKYFPWKNRSTLKKAITAEEKAKRRIEELRERNLNVTEFYEELSMILRLYIEERYEIKAQTKTTEEFLVSFRENQKEGQVSKEPLSAFLQMADLVKFAKEKPTEAACDEALKVISHIITL